MFCFEQIVRQKVSKQTNKIDRVFYSWINTNSFEYEPINNLTYSIHINHVPKNVSTHGTKSTVEHDGT